MGKIFDSNRPAKSHDKRVMKKSKTSGFCQTTLRIYLKFSFMRLKMQTLSSAPAARQKVKKIIKQRF